MLRVGPQSQEKDAQTVNGGSTIGIAPHFSVLGLVQYSDATARLVAEFIIWQRISSRLNGNHYSILGLFPMVLGVYVDFRKYSRFLIIT